MRKIKFETEKYYHIYNRGTDKRVIFLDQKDLQRFFQSMTVFNIVEPIGGIDRSQLKKNQPGKLKLSNYKLVSFICYCLNPNHYHFMIKQLVDKGIERFMHRLGVGYSKYFNQKHKRDGGLFQGTYKAILIDSDDYLLHLSAYINLNHKVHQYPQLRNLVSQSSWSEYLNRSDSYCDKDIVLNQFSTASEYREFAERSLKEIQERKELEKLLLD